MFTRSKKDPWQNSADHVICQETKLLKNVEGDDAFPCHNEWMIKCKFVCMFECVTRVWVCERKQCWFVMLVHLASPLHNFAAQALVCHGQE